VWKGMFEEIDARCRLGGGDDVTRQDAGECAEESKQMVHRGD
jgi:hypothetical protein